MKYQEIVAKQKHFFKKGKTREVSFRIEQLKRLKTWIKNNEEKIFSALYKDLHKSPFEVYEVEILGVIKEIEMAIAQLPQWAKPQKAKTPLVLFRSASKIYHDPLGNVLILTAWNYPFTLALMPLVGAIAAGNCCVLKPSELAPATSSLLAEMITECFDEEYCAIIEGGVAEVTELLKEKFDLIHYTGSARVGKIIAQAGAEKLSPVVLELGGKSPCIVDETANIEVSAKRIILGKFMNAGQTCVAPDYILVKREFKDEFVEALKAKIKEFYGFDAQKSPDYCRIINEKHFDRICQLLDDSFGTVYGGERDRNDLYIEPTLLENVDVESPIMKEEIFGPILPILTYDDINQGIELAQKVSEKPLSVYIFSHKKEVHDKVIQELQFGGGAINTTGLHVVNSNLPFGGVGNSGMGNYHGKWSFETFSHKKSILAQSIWPNFDIIFPPYTEAKMKWLKRM